MEFNPNYNPYSGARSVHYAKNGMVATSQPLAAQAGLDIMKQGGNAVDAAIATAACLTVTEPTSNGIGGDAFAIVWMKGLIFGLNSSGSAPRKISIDAVKSKGHDVMPKMGWLPVTVPGAPAAWAALSRRFGALTLQECLEPAIEYAREGFAVSPVVGKYWDAALNAYAKNKDKEYHPFFDTFAPKGRSPRVGEMMRLRDHANTLEEIGETLAESFYRGNLADKIVTFSEKTSGFLSESDLADFYPTWVEPISTSYRNYDIWEMPPNGQGLVALLALNILKGYEFDPADRDAMYTFHRQFEATKLAFTAGKEFITDPNHMRVSVEELLSEDYAARLRSYIGDMAVQPAPIEPNNSGTVYLATADGQGNMVSYIQSNYMGFGSGLVVPNTGIALQNRGADFSLDPAHANALAGGKRSYHTIIPGFITRGGHAIGSFGVMGGYMQPQGHVQVVMNSIDFGLNPQAALDAPRWQWIQDKLFHVEHAFPRHIAQNLALRGHQIQPLFDSGSFGRGQIIWRDPDTGVLAGGTESRCDGAIAAW
ncbi:MAG: gamma-glutamyltransferase family protein [Defluviitaleaceae bacterium]|nr:gamma-glutamyltransferase family protein [Defluviitaleaceae bacterium]